MRKNNPKKESVNASLFRLKKEMAKPRMARSTRKEFVDESTERVKEATEHTNSQH